MAVVRFGRSRVSRVEGIEDVRRAFGKLGPVAVGRITHALNLGAAEIQATAKTLAPVATGELQGAIEVRDSLEGFSAKGIIGALAVGSARAAKSVRRYIGVFPASRASPGWYAAFVEFGTSPRVKGKAFTTAAGRKKKSAGNTHPGSKAKPFLFPAYFLLRGRVKRRIAREINAGIKALARLRKAA